MTRPIPRGGFTLLEVVLAIVLALVLVVALLAFYRQTEDIRASVGSEIETISSERAVMEHMTSELRCAIPWPQAGVTLQGTNTGMQFATTVVPGADAWAVPSAVDGNQGPSGSDREIVGYQLLISEDKDGNAVIEGLERTSQKRVVAVAVDGVDIQDELVAPQIQFLHLAYWDGAAWADAWSGTDMPAAVEIILGQKPLPDNVDPAAYPYPIFRRVVALPAGVKPAASGTIVLGLDGEATP